MKLKAPGIATRYFARSNFSRNLIHNIFFNNSIHFYLTMISGLQVRILILKGKGWKGRKGGIALLSLNELGENSCSTMIIANFVSKP